MGIALFWLAVSIIVGVAANTRGRSGAGWFALSIVISRILAGLLLLALGPIAPKAIVSNDRRIPLGMLLGGAATLIAMGVFVSKWVAPAQSPPIEHAAEVGVPAAPAPTVAVKEKTTTVSVSRKPSLPVPADRGSVLPGSSGSS
jgi:hypothetical protein